MAGHMYNGRETELLIPASSLEVLKIAVIFGADAVYIGGEAFGLRAKAKNFSIEDMKEGVKFAHERNVKVYVTANILAHNYDLEGARAYFEELKEVGPDALIISDPGMFTIAKEVLPDIDIHISTQANNTNYMTYNFWWNQGAKRVVSARELSLEEIKEIREHIPDEMEIETFMHGAMCISYSGRCLLSSFLAGRDANRGACTHPCRWKYAVVEENRPGQYMPVYENERGTYIFNSKDLCMIEHIPEMVSSGIDSFKIEGRFKDGDVVELDIDMKPRAEKRTDAGINVYMGPLLYSVDIDENVEIIKDQFKTSVAFPAYNVTPASKWNFGLPENPEITVVNTGKKGFPWTPDSTPVKLKVTAFEIPEWRLLGDTTPGLPEEKIQVSSECEEIEMVPSGCTRIRMTTLPVVEYCK